MAFFKERKIMMKAVPIVTLILVIGLALFVWVAYQKEQEQVAKYEELNQKRRPLNVKKEELKQELEELAKAYEADRQPKGTTQLLFTDLDAQVYSVCYPIMKEYGYTGVLALTRTQLPGADGCMSVEQFQELLNEGWTTCIMWETEASVETWWPLLQEELQQFGLETGQVIYFPKGSYSEGIDGKLQELGFTIVVYNEGDGEISIQLQEEEGLWHLGAVGFMSKEPKKRLTEAVAQKGNIVYLIGFELEEEKYDEDSFRIMLGYFDTHEANEELLVGDMEEAREHYRNRSVEYDQAKQEEYRLAKEALEAELAQVEAQLKELEVQ